MINKNLIQFVCNSCTDALTNDKEYMQMQKDYASAEESGDTESQQEIQDEMEARAEETCFVAGFNAALEFIRGKSYE